MDWNIFGHEWAVNLLRSHAAGGNLRHAYLFNGPEGVGRETLALRFAQALNCRQPPAPGEFCGACKDCRQIQTRQYPDLSVVLPEDGHKDVRIDQVRELQHTLALSPYAATYRIALLPDFQHVTEQAENALLKTLEEPPDKVVLLLTVDALESLLPTIVSRCEVIRLRPASLQDTNNYLVTSFHLPAEEAKLIAHLSGGRIGAAVRMVEDPESITQRAEQLEAFLNLLSSTRYERFNLADKLTKSYKDARQNALEAVTLWLSFWRDVFVRATGSGLPLVNVDLEEQVNQASIQLEARAARALVIAHEKALQELNQYTNAQLLLEALMLQWPILSIAIPERV
ncbi:MAG: DNA polymerase III subunit delta' [Brevefilum sp.]